MTSDPILAKATLLELSPTDVLIPERIGFLHEDKAAALGRLMAVDGQRDPIKVARNLPSKPIAEVVAEGKKPWRLVTGMHRLMGATYEAITVFAIEVKGKPEDLAELEASENLHRRPLGPIERAKFTAALVQAAQERIAREHGDISHQRLGAKLRWERVKAGEETAEKALAEEADDTADKMSAVYGWQESVADALGFDKRTIRRDLSLYRLLIEPFPELIEALSKHPVVGENANQLKEIAQVKSEARRREVIEALLADDELSADEARVMVGIDRPAGPTPLPYMKHFNAIEGGWSRLGTAQKRQFLPRIAGMIPEGMKRDLRDLLNKELGDQRPALPPPDAGDAREAMSQAMKLLRDLQEGERGVSDEEIEEAFRVLQAAQFGLPVNKEAGE